MIDEEHGALLPAMGLVSEASQSVSQSPSMATGEGRRRDASTARFRDLAPAGDVR
jgi:hypothetical protein